MAEKKYIELQKALSVCEMHYQHCLEMHDWSGDATADDIKEDIEKLPTADVVEVKHGYNKTSMNHIDEFWCSVCGFCCADYTETKYDEDGDYTYSCECEFDFCPRCGAKMDGKKEGD